MNRLARESHSARRLSVGLLSSAASLALLAMPQAAFAQAAPAAEDAAGGNEIIVNARKQDETLQEVPVTITSVGADTLEKYSVDEVSDITSRVPTLNIQVGGSGSGGQISLRGVGSTNISASFDSAVAFDYDGVQISTMRLVQSAFMDTAQIDILKGPQSLFFGKSASAGVFAIRSQDPTRNWEIGARASYELEEDGYLVGGYISGPLTDTLGIRIAGQFNDINKFVELQAGTPAVNKQRGLQNFVGRLTLDWEPVPGFDANLKVQYAHNKNDGAIGHSDVYCGANGVADPVVLFGTSTLPFTLVIPAGYDCKHEDGKYFLPDTAPLLAASVPTASGPTKALGFNGVPFGDTKLWFGRLKLDFDVTDNLTFTSVSGYVDLDATDVDNYSYAGVGPAFVPAALGGSLTALGYDAIAAINGPGVPYGVGVSDPRNTLQQFSQEMRLTSKNDGPFNFLLGGFYEWRKFGFDTAQNAVNIAMISPDLTLPIYTVPNPLAPIGPGNAPVFSRLAAGTGFTFDWDKNHVTKTDAWSMFGSVIIDLSDKLELSGGIRYTKENKTQTISVPYVHNLLEFTNRDLIQESINGDGVPVYIDPCECVFVDSIAFVSDGYFSGPIKFSDSNVSPEVTLKYEVNPDVNVFASFKTGFKSGGIDNSALPSNSLSQAAISGDFSGLIYKSETATGGEIGIKSQWNNRSFTFNATAFYYVFDDLQVQTFNGSALQFVTSNAGEVTTKGVDIGWGWRTPVEGLSLSGNVAWLDAEFTKDYISLRGFNLKGRDAPRAPNWSGNLAFDWEIPMSDALQLTLNGNAQYSGSFFTTQTAPNDYKQSDYVTLDASVSIGDPDGKWKLSLIAANLTDKIYTSSSGERPFVPAANSFGIPTGDDLVVSQNRGRQVFLEASVKF